MKLCLLFFLLLLNSAKGQNVELNDLHTIARCGFPELDYLMLGKHSFTRVTEIEDHNQRVYTNDSSEPDRLMVITVIKTADSCGNVLSIVNGSEQSVVKLKADLPSEGFVYSGKKKITEDITVSQYTKENFTVSVTDTTTSTGAYQVLFACKTF